MTDKQKVTMASVILRRFGFTNREAARFWGVREETVAKWVTGETDMPTTMQLTALEQINAWQSYSRHMAGIYHDIFQEAPEAYIGILSANDAAAYGVPESDGFISNTIASICAYLAPKHEHLVLITSEEAAREDTLTRLRECAFLWAINFVDLFNMETAFGMTELAMTEFLVSRLRRDLGNPVAAMLSTDGITYDRRWTIHFINTHDFVADFANEDGEADERHEYFEVSFTPLSLDSPFDFYSDDQARVRLVLENGTTMDVGLATGDSEADFVAMNAAVADMLNEIFGTPAKMKAAFEKQRAVEQSERDMLH